MQDIGRMKRRRSQIVAAVFAAIVFLPLAQLHGAQLRKVRLAFSALAYANPPFWIAHELKLFEKYGVDSELVYVGGARPFRKSAGRRRLAQSHKAPSCRCSARSLIV
jgi:ABC-type nitrate/sulfonate/bicarbonate transport system substrate-binding protein